MTFPVVNMEHIATWVTTMADATDPVINRILKAGLDKGKPLEVKLIARHASTTFVGVAKEDHKIRSSIYSTASHAIDPWLEPSVAHSATNDPRHSYSAHESWDKRPRFVDLEWLMGGGPGRSNTLYLTAPQPEFERLSPVLGGLLADLKDCIHAWDIAGRRLDKPLLILIDEAGQLELGWLPGEVSTIAALGAFFVTCWQNLSQIQHRYGTLADAVLSGHRSKCFFAGVDDLTTTRYLTNLLGAEYVTRLSTSNDVPSLLGGRHVGRRSVSRAEQRVDFAPPNTVRQMVPGEAVLLHGTLPPIHLERGPLVGTEDPRRSRPPRQGRQPVTAEGLADVPARPGRPSRKDPAGRRIDAGLGAGRPAQGQARPTGTQADSCGAAGTAAREPAGAGRDHSGHRRRRGRCRHPANRLCGLRNNPAQRRGPHRQEGPAHLRLLQ